MLDQSQVSLGKFMRGTVAALASDFQHFFEISRQRCRLHQYIFSFVLVKVPISADMAQEPAIEKKPKSFEALTPELSSWILDFAQSSGFARTTPVQAMAIPLLMGNKDLVVEVSMTSFHAIVLC
jgi:hypothetical protein